MDLGQHRDILTSQLVDKANLLHGWIRESCVLIGYPSRQDGTILPARDFPPWSLYWLSLFGQDGWILASFCFTLLLTSTSSHAKKELGQYTAILTWRLVNKAYVLCFEGRVYKKVFKEVQWIVLQKSKRGQWNSCRNLIVSAYERVVLCKSAFKGSKKR